MHYSDLSHFLTKASATLPAGPIAMIFAEDAVEIEATVRHHHGCAFGAILLFMPASFPLDPETGALVHRIDWDTSADDMLERAVNSLLPQLAGRWLYYCYNAEFLFYPFAETRTIGELLNFHAQERRDAMVTYTIDLYAGNLKTAGLAVDMDNAFLDGVGYYALARRDPVKAWAPKDRQLEFFGGLRWRFEEHVPWERRRIDRVSLFRAKPGLELLDGFVFNDEEYNTYACEWHNNISCVVASFRTAKALKLNPGSCEAITDFKWRNSVGFEWDSRQLLDMGLMEPGQWF